MARPGGTSQSCDGPESRWHYDDLSCCHAAIPYEDVATLTGLLMEMRANDYPNGNEWAEYQDRLDTVLALLPLLPSLPEVAPHERSVQ